jgi:hypothetical protein
MNYIDPKLEGWMMPGELEWLYNTAGKMDSIIEMGCYKGKSTHALCTGTKGKVYSIDPWIPCIEFPDGDLVHNDFVKNVGHFKNLKFFRSKNEDVVDQFEDKSIDMIFIDAYHVYEWVKGDIDRWLPKAKKLICGHDYGDPTVNGVKKAVDEKFGYSNVTFVDSIWIVWL